MRRILAGLALYTLAGASILLLEPQPAAAADEAGKCLCSWYVINGATKHDCFSAHHVSCRSGPHSPTGKVIPGNCDAGGATHELVFPLNSCGA